MKKLILILMPICIVLAFYSYYLSKDINFSLFLTGLSNINVEQFDFSSAQQAFNKLDFTQYFSEATEWYEYITAIFEMIGGFFSSIIYMVKFVFEFTKFIFTNIFEFTKFLFSYLFS